MEWNILGSWNQQQQGLTVAWFVAVTFFKQLWKWWLFSKTVKMMARFEREWRNHSPAFVRWLQMQGGGTNAGEWWRDCLAIISFRAIMKFQFFKIWSVIHKTVFFLNCTARMYIWDWSFLINPFSCHQKCKSTFGYITGKFVVDWNSKFWIPLYGARCRIFGDRENINNLKIWIFSTWWWRQWRFWRTLKELY